MVVIQQPQQVVQTVRPTGSSDYGSGAMIIAIGVTIFIVLFGCWWSLICSIAGIVLASNVSCMFTLYFKQCSNYYTSMDIDLDLTT